MRFIKILNAFTLAEVLITLGIIGVVAAILIPTIMEKVQDWQFKQAAKEAYSKCSQVIQQMKQDEGGTLSGYHGKAYTFKPVFMKYFKIIKDCGWSNCVKAGNTNDVYKTLQGKYADGWRIDEGQFITSDGMFWGIENEPAASHSRIIITVDVNGYQKLPNTYGKDVFMFELIKDNLVPEGKAGTYAPYLCDRNVAHMHQGFGCMYYVMQGIEY